MVGLVTQTGSDSFTYLTEQQTNCVCVCVLLLLFFYLKVNYVKTIDKYLSDSPKKEMGPHAEREEICDPGGVRTHDLRTDHRCSTN